MIQIYSELVVKKTLVLRVLIIVIYTLIMVKILLQRNELEHRICYLTLMIHNTTVNCAFKTIAINACTVFMKHIHNISVLCKNKSRKNTSAIIHPEKKPDTKEPNNYCCACERTYTIRNCYLAHLRYVHFRPLIIK